MFDSGTGVCITILRVRCGRLTLGILLDYEIPDQKFENEILGQSKL